MNRRIVWIAVLVISVLLVGSALGAMNIPQTVKDISLPSFLIPDITSIELADEAVSISISGEYDGVAAWFSVEAAEGYDYIYVDLSPANGKLQGALPNADTYISYSFETVTVQRKTSEYTFEFSYNETGEFEYGTASSDSTKSEYSFGENGQIYTYSNWLEGFSAGYDDNGRLDGYSVENEDGLREEFDAQGQLIRSNAYDSKTGIQTTNYYSNGEWLGWMTYGNDGSSSRYMANGTLREQTIVNDDGTDSTAYYGADGALTKKNIRNLDGISETFDSEGVILSRYQYDEDNQGFFEQYENGAVVLREEYLNLPDGRSCIDTYERGVFTERIIRTDDTSEHYDAQGNMTLREVYTDNETLTYDGQGNLVERTVEDETGSKTYDGQGKLISFTVDSETMSISYNADNTILSLYYYQPLLDDVFYDHYGYEASEGKWYFNGNPYDGPAPVGLSKIELPQKAN